MWPLTTHVHEFKCTTHWHEHAFMFQYLDMHTLIKYATNTHTHTCARRCGSVSAYEECINRVFEPDLLLMHGGILAITVLPWKVFLFAAHECCCVMHVCISIDFVYDYLQLLGHVCACVSVCCSRGLLCHTHRYFNWFFVYGHLQLLGHVCARQHMLFVGCKAAFQFILVGFSMQADMYTCIPKITHTHSLTRMYTHAHTHTCKHTYIVTKSHTCTFRPP